MENPTLSCPYRACLARTCFCPPRFPTRSATSSVQSFLPSELSASTQLCTASRSSTSLEHHAYLLHFFFFFFLHTFSFQLLDKPCSQESSLLPPGSCLPFLSRSWVQHSHCSSIFHRMLLTHALALSASQFEHKKKSQRIYTSMHSAGLELTKLTFTRLEDNLIRHRSDRHLCSPANFCCIPRTERVTRLA